MKAHVKYWASPCEIFGVQNWHWSGHSALYDVQTSALKGLVRPCDSHLFYDVGFQVIELSQNLVVT